MRHIAAARRHAYSFLSSRDEDGGVAGLDFTSFQPRHLRSTGGSHTRPELRRQ